VLSSTPNILAAFNFDLNILHLYAVIVICIRASWESGILYSRGEELTR
jgi:hypothetical protein